MANSEDPDEMPHKAAFHSGLHFLLRQNRSSGKGNKVVFFPEIITFNPA